MVFDTIASPTNVSLSPTPPGLFVDPERNSNGSPWFEFEFSDQGNSLKSRHDTGTVVLSALADIPRIDVTAHHDDLFRVLRARYLANDVRRIRIGFGVSGGAPGLAMTAGEFTVI